jgi:hypothetical protein
LALDVPSPSTRLNEFEDAGITTLDQLSVGSSLACR